MHCDYHFDTVHCNTLLPKEVYALTLLEIVLLTVIALSALIGAAMYLRGHKVRDLTKLPRESWKEAFWGVSDQLSQ